MDHGLSGPSHQSVHFLAPALTTKLATEVAFQLADIFLLLDAPALLQSDKFNGSEVTSHEIHKLKRSQPDLMMVYGKPSHPQSHGSAEHANA